MDDIIEKGPFMGSEIDIGGSGNSCTVAPGLGLYKLILALYEVNEFVRDDGAFNMMTVVARKKEIL